MREERRAVARGYRGIVVSCEILKDIKGFVNSARSVSCGDTRIGIVRTLRVIRDDH